MESTVGHAQTPLVCSVRFDSFARVAVAVCIFSSCILSAAWARAEAPHTITLVARPTKSETAWDKRVRLTRSGKVLSFDSKRVVLELSDGERKGFNSSLVAAIDFEWATPAARAAMQLCDAQKYREAIPALEKAYPELPLWQQKLMLGRLVGCLSAIGEDRIAGIIFLNATQADLPAIVYQDAPLAWTPKQPAGRLATEAEKWLRGETEHERLLGASWSLTGSGRNEAAAVLRKLKASSDPSIAALATAQTWRTSTPPETLQQLTQWISFRDKLSLPLQLGPTQFLADRSARVGQPDIAVAQWLRIASLYPDRQFHAGQALDRAEQQLRTLQRTTEALSVVEWKQQLDQNSP